MFINTGGLPVSQQHNLHGDKLHLHPQRHHHGHRNLQQFGQLHLPHWSRCLAASRHLLLPGPRHHGSFSPAALLLKLPQPTLTSFFLCLSPPPPPSQSPHPIVPPSPASPFSHRDHKTNMDGLHNLLRPP